MCLTDLSHSFRGLSFYLLIVFEILVHLSGEVDKKEADLAEGIPHSGEMRGLAATSTKTSLDELPESALNLEFYQVGAAFPIMSRRTLYLHFHSRLPCVLRAVSRIPPYQQGFGTARCSANPQRHLVTPKDRTASGGDPSTRSHVHSSQSFSLVAISIRRQSPVCTSGSCSNIVCA